MGSSLAGSKGGYMYQMQGPWSTTVGSGTPVEGSNGPMTQQPGYVGGEEERRPSLRWGGEERRPSFVRAACCVLYAACCVLCVVCCVLRAVCCQLCTVYCVLCVVRSSARRAVCCVLAVGRVVCAICVLLHH